MKESSRFYSSLTLLILLNVIIKPIWIFGIDRQVQNEVGTKMYGVYFSLFNLSIVLSFLLDWGFTAFFNRQLVIQKENFIRQAGSFLLIKLLFAIIYIAIVLMVALVSGVERIDILLSVIMIQVFASLFLFFRAIITAHQWFRTDAWLSVLDKTLMIFLCGSLIYFPAVFGIMTIGKFLFTQAACTALAMLCALTIIFRRGVNFSLGKKSLLNKRIFSAIIPFALIVLLMSVHYRLDGFLLERMHNNGDYEAGIYAGAYRLLDAANMTGYLFASFLLPYIAKHWNRKDEIQTVIQNSRHFLLMFSVMIIATVFFLAPWIQQILYQNPDEKGIEILKWCISTLIGYSLVQIYGTVMTASGHVVSFCYITAIAVGINLIINLLLIPSMGAKACCIASLVSQWFCGIAAMLLLKRKSGINIHFASLSIYIFTLAILSGLYYWGNDLAVSKWFLIATGGIITLLLMIITKLFLIKTWIQTLKRSNL